MLAKAVQRPPPRRSAWRTWLRLPEVGRLYAQASKLKRNVTTSLGQSCLTADLETSHGVSCEIRAVTHGSPIVFSKTGWCLMR